MGGENRQFALIIKLNLFSESKLTYVTQIVKHIFRRVVDHALIYNMYFLETWVMESLVDSCMHYIEIQICWTF